MKQTRHMEYPQYAAAWKSSSTRWRGDAIGSWYMRAVRGKTRWTRAFHNTGWPTIVYSGRPTQGMSGVAVWMLSRQLHVQYMDAYENRWSTCRIWTKSATESLLCDLRRKPRNITLIRVDQTNDSSYGWTNGEVLLRLVSSSEASPLGRHAAPQGRHAARNRRLQRWSRQRRTVCNVVRGWAVWLRRNE